MDEITKEAIEMWDRRLEGGLDGGDVRDVLGDWETDVARYEKELTEVAVKYGKSVLLVNDQNITMEKMVTELEALRKREKFLIALESAGVDNWTGYSYAFEILEEME